MTTMHGTYGVEYNLCSGRTHTSFALPNKHGKALTCCVRVCVCVITGVQHGRGSAQVATR